MTTQDYIRGSYWFKVHHKIMYRASQCSELSVRLTGYTDHVINQALYRVQNVSREMALMPAESNSEETRSFSLIIGTI